MATVKVIRNKHFIYWLIKVDKFCNITKEPKPFPSISRSFYSKSLKYTITNKYYYIALTMRH